VREHELDQQHIVHRGREIALGEMTPQEWETIQEEMRADIIAAYGEEYMAALEARIFEIVATHPLFRAEHQEQAPTRARGSGGAGLGQGVVPHARICVDRGHLAAQDHAALGHLAAHAHAVHGVATAQDRAAHGVGAGHGHVVVHDHAGRGHGAHGVAAAHAHIAEAATYVRLYTWSQTTCSGYLVARRRDEVVLKNATVVFEGQIGGEHPVQGAVHVDRDHIDFYVVTG
jgi:hypothetical protein